MKGDITAGRIFRMIPSDEELVIQAKNGDKQAFVTLFKRHKNKIYTYLCRYVGNDETAQDLTLETFLSVYNHLDQYDEQGKFLSWVYKIATNLGKMEFRKKARRAEVSLEEPAAEDGSTISLSDVISDESSRPDVNAIRAEVREFVFNAVSRLDDIYKDVLMLCDIEGLTYEEAAAALNSNAKTIATRVRRAREMLFALLVKYRMEL